MNPATRREIIRAVGEDGFTFVAESVCDVTDLFFLAYTQGWAFCMPPADKRRSGYEHPLVSKEPISAVLSEYVAKLRECRAAAEGRR